jgi:hypothetical protein
VPRRPIRYVLDYRHALPSAFPEPQSRARFIPEPGFVMRNRLPLDGEVERL